MVWSTRSRTSRRTSTTTTVPPSSRHWAASSSSWPLATGRSWPTPPENPRSTAVGGASGLLPLIEVLLLARCSLTTARALFSSVSSADGCPGDRSVDPPAEIMARADSVRRLGGGVQFTCLPTYGHSPRRGGCRRPLPTLAGVPDRP